MKRALFAAVVLAPLLAGAQSSTAVLAEPIEAVVTVTRVDPHGRTVTVRGPRGNLQTLAVPPEAQNLDRVKAGDRFKVAYAEALVVALAKKGEPAASAEETITVAPKGARPGGVKVRTLKLTAVVDAIDYKNRHVALRGPKGNTVAFPVSVGVNNLDGVAVGDTVSVVYSQAVALEMVPQ